MDIKSGLSREQLSTNTNNTRMRE